MAAREYPDQQQMPDVRARDEQDKHDDGEHEFVRGEQSTSVIAWRLPQWPEFDAAASVRIRIVGFQSFRHGGNLLLCLLASHPGLEPYVGFNPARAAIPTFVAAAFKVFLHRRGDPELHASPS